MLSNLTLAKKKGTTPKWNAVIYSMEFFKCNKIFEKFKQFIQQQKKGLFQSHSKNFKSNPRRGRAGLLIPKENKRMHSTRPN